MLLKQKQPSIISAPHIIHHLKFMPFSTGYDWNISNMKINLWYCTHMNQWRWSLTDDHRPIVRQERGHCGCSSAVERYPSKLDVVGSIPIIRSWAINSAVECLVYTEYVGGSNPSSPMFTLLL